MNLYVIKSLQGDRTGNQFWPGYCGSLKWKQMLIRNCPLPPPPNHPCPPPQSFSKPWGSAWADGAKWDSRCGGVWISPSTAAIDRYWGYRTVMRMLIQHREVSRSHSCQTETRTRTLIDCIMAGLAVTYSADSFPCQVKTQQSSRCKFRSVSQG